MAYTAWSVVFGEQPSTAKWNQLGANDAGFRDGTNISSGVITNAKLSSTAVSSAKVDWTTSGGVWWQELGRTTLGASATTMSVSSFTARKYLRLIGSFIPGAAQLDVYIRFNSDSGNNYAWHYNNTSGAAPTDTFSTSSIVFTRSFNAQLKLVVADVLNIATQNKVLSGEATEIYPNATNLTYKATFGGGWYNSASQVSTITVYDSAGTANVFASGSELIVLGHD